MMYIEEMKNDIKEYDLYEVVDNESIGNGYYVTILNEDNIILVVVRYFSDNGSEDKEGAIQLTRDKFFSMDDTQLEKLINEIIYYNMNEM